MCVRVHVCVFVCDLWIKGAYEMELKLWCVLGLCTGTRYYRYNGIPQSILDTTYHVYNTRYLILILYNDQHL